MKRRHLRDDVIRMCERAKSLRPDMAFGADIIAGFPTETEEMFQNTLKIVEECGLAFLHVFPYSERPGTPAAKMPQVFPAAFSVKFRLFHFCTAVFAWAPFPAGQRCAVPGGAGA